MSDPYLLIADQLAERIGGREWLSGELLPGITELAAQYGVAQSTILHALDELYRRHLVVPAPKQRYLVRSRPAVQRLASERFASNRNASGFGGHYVDFEGVVAKIRVDVERIQVVNELPPEVAWIFGNDVQALIRHRRYFADDIPTQIATSYVPIDIATELPPLWQENTGPGGMYARFRELGHSPLRFREELFARLPTPEERESLQLPRGMAVIDVTRIVVGPERLLEVCILLLSADQYKLSYTWTVD